MPIRTITPKSTNRQIHHYLKNLGYFNGQLALRKLSYATACQASRADYREFCLHHILGPLLQTSNFRHCSNYHRGSNTIYGTKWDQSEAPTIAALKKIIISLTTKNKEEVKHLTDGFELLGKKTFYINHPFVPKLIAIEFLCQYPLIATHVASMLDWLAARRLVLPEVLNYIKQRVELFSLILSAGKIQARKELQQTDIDLLNNIGTYLFKLPSTLPKFKSPEDFFVHLNNDWKEEHLEVKSSVPEKDYSKLTNMVVKAGTLVRVARFFDLLIENNNDNSVGFWDPVAHTHKGSKKSIIDALRAGVSESAEKDIQLTQEQRFQLCYALTRGARSEKKSFFFIGGPPKGWSYDRYIPTKKDIIDQAISSEAKEIAKEIIGDQRLGVMTKLLHGLQRFEIDMINILFKFPRSEASDAQILLYLLYPQSRNPYRNGNDFDLFWQQGINHGRIGYARKIAAVFYWLGHNDINTHVNKHIAAVHAGLLADLLEIDFHISVLNDDLVFMTLSPRALMQHLFDTAVKKASKNVNEVVQTFDALPFGTVPALSGIILEYADIPLHKDCRLSSCLKFINSPIYKTPPTKTLVKEPLKTIQRRKSQPLLKDFEYKEEQERRKSWCGH